MKSTMEKPETTTTDDPLMRYIAVLKEKIQRLEKECADTRVNLNDMTKIIEVYQKITGLTITVLGVCNDDDE